MRMGQIASPNYLRISRPLHGAFNTLTAKYARPAKRRRQRPLQSRAVVVSEGECQRDANHSLS
jgi:hypothetical protein